MGNENVHIEFVHCVDCAWCEYKGKVGRWGADVYFCENPESTRNYLDTEIYDDTLACDLVADERY